MTTLHSTVSHPSPLDLSGEHVCVCLLIHPNVMNIINSLTFTHLIFNLLTFNKHSHTICSMVGDLEVPPNPALRSGDSSPTQTPVLSEEES